MAYNPGDPTRRYLEHLASDYAEARRHESRELLREDIIPAYIVLAAAELRTEVGGVVAGRHFEARAAEVLGVMTPDLVHLRHRIADLLSSDTYADPYVGDLAFKPGAYIVFQENVPEGFTGIREVVRSCMNSDYEQRAGALATEAWAVLDVQAVKL